MAISQPVKRGEWIELKIIGSGGFGQVVLWKQEVSPHLYVIVQNVQFMNNY